MNYSGKILIPGKVREETCVEWEEETPLIERLIKSTTKLQVVRIESARLSKKLMEDFHIDAGEAEAVGLALKEKGRETEGRP